MADKSYVGDIGTVIEIDIGEDISLASLVKFYVRKPGGTIVEWVGSVYDNNYIRYTTVEDDFDVAGEYAVNPYIEIGGWKGTGETVEFYIFNKYV